MKNYIIKKNDYIEYLQFNKLLEFNDELSHAFTLKTFNVGLNKNDSNSDFNFEEISKLLNVEVNQIYKPKQRHTANIANIIDGKENLNDIDGLITNKTNKALVIAIADCICLMMYDPQNKVISNIHSGWRGTLQRIAQKAVYSMVNQYNCRAENIICCIGPCIRKDHFLVNQDVVQLFENEFADYCRNNDVIEETDKFNENGRQYRIDSVLINKLMLNEAGITYSNIIDSEICTMCESDKFHSFRVEGENYSKNMGIMMLKH